MPRFKGIPVDEEEVVTKSRFGGILIEEDEPDSAQRPPTKPPIFGGVPGAYSAPSADIGPSYMQRVSSDIEEQGRKDVERQQQGGNVPLSKVGGGLQSMAAFLRQAPGAYELGQPIASAAQKVMTKEPAPKTTGKFPSFGTYSTPAVDPGAMMKESPNLRSAVDIATGAGEVVPFAVGATKGLGFAGKGVQDLSASRQLGKLEKKIEKGIDKGIKPRFTAEKKTVGGLDNYKVKASDAVMAIDEYKDKINLVDSYGDKIALPRNNAEFAQAIEKTKEQIFKEYSSMASAASEGGVRFSTDQIQSKLDDVIRDIGNPDDVVDYAYKMKMELEKLNGASPEVIQKRIKYYNESLENYYAGRGGVTQAKAKVDASVANAMREELDGMITSAQGEGYQALKNKYGALKAIEKDVNHRALQIAKKSPAGLLDMTDVFTGGEIAAGVMSMNPVLVAKGLTGKAAKEYMKWLNNPDKYIGDMFKAVSKTSKNNPLGMLKNQRGAVGIENPQVKSENFKNWFGDWEKAPERASKVVDESGKPIIVYHGTDSPFGSELFEYDLTKSGTGGFERLGENVAKSMGNKQRGIYTTSSIDHAKMFGDNAIPLYVDIKKPSVVNIKNELRGWAEESGYDSVEDMVKDYYGGSVYDAANLDQMAIEKLKDAVDAGNDGIIIDFDGLTEEGLNLGKIAIPLKSTQIKSASINTGAFNPSNPDIRGSGAVPLLAGTAAAGLGGLTAYEYFKNRK